MIGRGQARVIHQFHYTASSADAVTQQMLFIRQALRKEGIEGEIFVGHNRAPLSYGIQSFMPARLWNSDLILVHHSHGNPLLSEILGVEIPKALIYHNITPASFFQHDPHMARLSQKGRRQISEFVGRTVAAFGVSQYNCAELELLGLRKPAVFPLLDLRETPTRPVLAKSLQPRERTLLFVGKLTPHKNQALLLQTLFYLQKQFEGKYRLVLVGRADPLYQEYLKLLARGLGVENAVTFTGPISQDQLEATYQQACAFVCASLHEGFCAPVVEAMQRDLPVFALPLTGVRETLGGAGVRLLSRQPHKMAEAIDALLSDDSAISSIQDGQARRVEELAEIHNSERVRALCNQLVDRLRKGRPQPALPEIYT